MDLASIETPLLHVIAEHDHIVPYEAAKPLVAMAGSRDKEELVLKGGQRQPGRRRDVAAKLAAEIGKALATEDLKARLADLGYEATSTGGDRFVGIVRQDTERWGAVIKSVGGITID